MAGIEAIEREFEARLKAFEADARACAIFAYTGFAFSHIARSDRVVRDRLNRHADYWNALTAGVQTAAFVAMGRVYEKTRRTYNGDALLKFAEKNRGIFARQAFEFRQIRKGLDSSIAKKSAAKAFELRPGGLNELLRQFEARRRTFEESVAPIRHKVYAHTGVATIEETDALFNKVRPRTLEDLVVFPLRLEDALFQFYHNGAPPKLAEPKSVISRVINSPPERGVSTWVHLHAAKNVADFLKWLRAMPLDDD